MVNYYVDDLVKNGVPKQNIIMELGKSGSFNYKEDFRYKFDDNTGTVWFGFDLRKHRPYFYKFLKRVHNKEIKQHKVTKWDRWSRDTIFGLASKVICGINDTEVVATQDTNDDRVMPILIVLAQDEAVRTKKRVSTGKQYKFEHGLYLGTERLYGYQKTKIKIEGREYLHLIPFEKEKQLIDDVFFGIDYKEVCKRHKISSTTYYNIRKNKFYAGYINYQGQERKGIHTPLITLELFKKCQ